MKVLKKLSSKILEIQARLILSLAYIVILPLFALIFKNKNEQKQRSWHRWKLKSDTLEDLKKQF